VHRDTRRFTVDATQRHLIGTAVLKQDVGDAGDALIAQLGRRPRVTGTRCPH
jgi:hypothetical protein